MKFWSSVCFHVWFLSTSIRINYTSIHTISCQTTHPSTQSRAKLHIHPHNLVPNYTWLLLFFLYLFRPLEGLETIKTWLIDVNELFNELLCSLYTSDTDTSTHPYKLSFNLFLYIILIQFCGCQRYIYWLQTITLTDFFGSSKISSFRVTYLLFNLMDKQQPPF